MNARTDSGWTAVPHGVWTLACSDRAKVLLGWLWSHNDRFRERLSVKEAARQIGWHETTMRRCLDELSAGGLLEVAVPKVGMAAQIVLDEARWQALHRRLQPVGKYVDGMGTTCAQPVDGAE